jgi:hypothetical protein
MFATGTRLEVNKDFIGIAEVCGLYPRGQGGYLEDHQQILINGFRITIPVSVMSTMFREVPAFTQIVEEVVVVDETPKAVAPEVKTVKKLTKKAY